MTTQRQLYKPLILLTFALVWLSFGPLALALQCEKVEEEQKGMLLKCHEGINKGNWNRHMDNFCQNNFDLPSPWLIKCLEFEYQNYENSPEKDRELDQEACQIYFTEDHVNAFKNHCDYDKNVDLPEHLRCTHEFLKWKYYPGHKVTPPKNFKEKMKTRFYKLFQKLVPNSILEKKPPMQWDTTTSPLPCKKN